MRTAAATRAATAALIGAAGVAVSLATSPLGAATPQCTDVAPNTTMCQTPGHTQITTSPDQAMTNPFPGWGFGGIGIGGGGIWFGGF